jgi:hypothetical protein
MLEFEACHGLRFETIVLRDAEDISTLTRRRNRLVLTRL